MTPIHIDTPVLLGLLERAVLFTNTDDTLPAMTCVRLDYDGAKTLTAWATDRYTAARVTANIPEHAEPGPSWSTLIHRDDVALISKAYRAGRSRTLCETLTVTRLPYQLALAPADVRANGNWDRVPELTVAVWTPASSMRPQGAILPAHVAFPDLAKLYDDLAADDVASAPATVNPRLLARFAKATDRWTPIQIEARGRKAMRVRIGDDFTGLIMPVTGGADRRERAA